MKEDVNTDTGIQTVSPELATNSDAAEPFTSAGYATWFGEQKDATLRHSYPSWKTSIY